MKRVILLACFLLLQQSLFATIRYVKQGAPLTNGGGGWSNASGDLQYILSISNPTDEVWVAKGTYKPSNTGDRSKYFDMKINVKVYGSFDGTETSPTQRVFDTAHLSILSGDLNGDDIPNFGNRSDNSACVVQLNKWQRGDGCYMDGFLIKGGYQKNNDPGKGGGGMYLWGSPHVVLNCIFWDNYSDKKGGGAYVNYHYTNNHEWNVKDLKFEMPPLFINCYFIGNKSGGDGGGMYYDYLVKTDFITIDVLQLAFKIYSVYGGVSQIFNAALESAASTIAGTVIQKITLDAFLQEVMVGQLKSAAINLTVTTISGITFSPQKVNASQFSSPSVIVGCIFSGNTCGAKHATACGGGLWTNASNSLIDCNFEKNSSPNKGGGIYSCSGGPGSFRLSPYEGETGWPAPDGMYVNRCSFRGNFANTYGGGIYTEISTGLSPWDIFGGLAGVLKKVLQYSVGSEYYFNCEFTGNKTGKKNGGGMYASLKNPQMTNCTFASNDADQGGGISLNRAHCHVWNTVIWGNHARSTNHHQVYKPPVSTFKANATVIQGGDFNTTNAEPYFQGPVTYASAPTTLGDFSIHNYGSAYNQGDNNFVNNVNYSSNGNVNFETRYDLTKGKRIANCIADKGAYEYSARLEPDDNGILYVNINAAPGGNGNSWEHAVKNLADVLLENNCDGSIREVWVAKGIYSPMYNASTKTATGDSRNYSFVIDSHISLYGGFQGNETSRSQRSIQGDSTILEGALNATTRIYHTVIFTNYAYGSTLDGFTIRNGLAKSLNLTDMMNVSNCTVIQAYGGGIYVGGYSAPNIANCIISGNDAYSTGGGIFIEDGSGIALLSSKILGNSASGLGQSVAGGLYTGSGNTTITNCEFRGNTAWDKGGAIIANQNAVCNVTNCLFTGNRVASGVSGSNAGGAAFNVMGNAHVQILNTSIAGNYSASNNGALQVSATALHPILKNCIVWGNRQGSNPISAQLANSCIIQNSIVEEGFSAGNGGSGTGISSSDPLFYTPYTGTNANTPNQSGNYNIPNTSPARDSGTTSFYLNGSGAPIAYDLAGNNRIRGCAIDKGAYEYQDSSNNIFPNAKLEPDNGIVYVDSSIAVSGDGHNWAAAVKEMADAVRMAQIDNRIKIIKVAQGTYRPLYSGDVSCGTVSNESKTFVMKGVRNNSGLLQDTVQYGWYGGYPSGGSSDDMRNPDLYPTILDGNMVNHVVIKLLYGDVPVPYAPSSFLDGFTIKKGSAYGPSTYLMVNGTIPISNTRGAGVYIKRDNQYSGEKFSIKNCKLEHNYAGNLGAALYLDTITAYPYNLELYHCTLTDNHIGYKGGAVYLEGNQTGTINGRITGCLFSGNEAYVLQLGNGDGGAFYTNAGGNLKFFSTAFTGNRGRGAGVFAIGGNHEFLNCTFASNEGSTSGFYGSNNTNVTFKNSILWGNQSSDPIFLQTNTPAVSYSILQNLPLAYQGANLHNSASDPMFVAPFVLSLPGLTPTTAGNYRIQLTGSAFNTGNNILISSSDTLYNHDLDGYNRIIACIADRGAYEFNIAPDKNGVLYVDSSAIAGTGDGSSWQNAMWDLADALEVIKCHPTPKISEIRVAKGTFKPKYIQDVNQSTDPKDKALFVSDSIKIYAGYPSGGGGDTVARNWELYPVVLDGRIGTDTYTHHVVILSGKGIMMDGLKIINGKAVGQNSVQSQGTIFQSQGGGINIASGSDAMIYNCLLDKDTATEYGGGIYVDGGNAKVQLYNCQFTQNQASEGGAVYTLNLTMPSALTNCSFKANKALANGAGIHLETSSPRIVNCSFTGNLANTRGAGIYCGGTSSPSIINSTFAANKSGSISSAVIDAELNNNNQTEYSYPKVKNCIVWGNKPVNTTNGYITPHATIYNSIIQGGFTANGSIVDTANPQFVNLISADLAPTTSGNYQLSSTSIAVDKGQNLLYLQSDTLSYHPQNLDLLQQNRVVGCSIDLGAYEYVSANILPPMAGDANGILYVDSTVISSGKGDSWATAIKDLAEAIRTATFDKNIKEIDVAQGTYVPKYDSLSTCSSNPGNLTFYLPANIQLIGGYPNGGGIKEPTQNITTLMGTWQANSITQQAYHVVTVKEDSTLTDGFVISGGNASGNNSDGQGGGMIVKSASGTIQNILFYANKADNGGGLYVSRDFDSTHYPDINRCYFYADTAVYGGGGLQLDKGTVSNCVLINNYSGNVGGAAFVTRGKINTSIFSGNTAVNAGGGICIGLGGADTGNAMLSCLISGNKVTASNIVLGGGGGIFFFDSTFSIINNTIAGNYSQSGGGVAGNFGKLINTIIWGNDGVNNPQVSLSNASLFDHCVVQGGNGNNTLNADPGFYDPIPGSMAPTLLGNYHIGSCSPASNSGILLPELMDALDLDGMVRSSDSLIDRGAYQFTDLNIRASGDGIVYVDSSKLTYGDGSSWDFASNSLADAIMAAQTDSSILEIKVAQGTYYPQYNAGNMGCTSGDIRDRAFTLPSGVAIWGGYPIGGADDSMRNPTMYLTIMSGNINRMDSASDNVYHVVIAAGPLANTVLDGFTVSGGYANGSGNITVNNKTIPRNKGGALVLAGNNNVRIHKCVLDKNFAQYEGGGILAIDTNNAIVSNCVISNNQSATYAGGVATRNYAATRFVNNLFVSNKANIGGGIGNYAHAQPAIINNTFYKNASTQWGAAMDNEGTTNVTVRNSIFSNNPDGANIAGSITNPSGVQYSLVQMPSGVIPGIGNINEDPLFTDTSNLKGPDNDWGTTDDGLHLSRCSLGINIGNNNLLSVSDTLDITGDMRIKQGIVDMGAYENKGFILDTIANHSFTADAQCGNAWKHFYQLPEKLIIAVNTTYINADSLTVSGKLNSLYGSGSITSLTQPFGLSDNLNPMNRSWYIQSATMPSGPVGIRFYFNEQDSADVAASYPFSNMQGLIVYKVSGTDAYNPSATGYKKYTYATTADTAHFTLGTYQGLRYVEFNVNAFSSGSIALISSTTPLPINLSEFVLQIDKCKVMLHWTMEGAINLKETAVQYSTDAINFSTISTLATKGSNAAYEYTVIQPDKTSYYRLKLVDNYGKYELSQVLMATTDCTMESNWSIVPNPMSDGGKLQLNLAGSIITRATIMVKDISGRQIATFNWAVHNGLQEMYLPFNGLAQGVYTVFLLDEQGHQINKPIKVVKK